MSHYKIYNFECEGEMLSHHALIPIHDMVLTLVAKHVTIQVIGLLTKVDIIFTNWYKDFSYNFRWNLGIISYENKIKI